MKIVIVGGGGHGRVVADILQSMVGMEPVAFALPDADSGATGHFGLPIIGEETLVDVEHHGIVVAVGDNRVRQKLYERFSGQGENLVTAIHPSAIIASDVELGDGCMICPGVIINTGAIIGNNVILNTGSIIEHECVVGDHSHVAPGAKLAGEVSVGDGVFVGLGANIIQG